MRDFLLMYDYRKIGGDMRSSHLYLYPLSIWPSRKRQEIIDPVLEPILNQLFSEMVNEKYVNRSYDQIRNRPDGQFVLF